MGKVQGDQSSGGPGAVSRSVSSSTHGWRGGPERYLWGGSRGLRAGRGFGDHLHHCSHWYHLLSSYYAPDTDRVLSSTAEVGISILILQMVTLKLREREREISPRSWSEWPGWEEEPSPGLPAQCSFLHSLWLPGALACPSVLL